MSEEQKQKISAAQRGRKLTSEHRKKLSEAWKHTKYRDRHRKPHSEETKIKIAQTHIRSRRFVGKNNPNWKDGSSRCYKTGYYSSKYVAWRKSVFERDGYKCTECGNTGYLTAHHIKSFAYFPKLRFELSNGLTLCEVCHSKTDNYKGRGRRKN